MESSLCPPSPGIDPFLSLGSWSIRKCSTPCRSVYLWSIRQCIPLGALRTLGSEPLTVLLSVGDPLGLLRSILVLPGELLGLLGILGTPWSWSILLWLGSQWTPTANQHDNVDKGRAFSEISGTSHLNEQKYFVSSLTINGMELDRVGWEEEGNWWKLPKDLKSADFQANDSLGDQCVDQGEGGRQN